MLFRISRHLNFERGLISFAVSTVLAIAARADCPYPYEQAGLTTNEAAAHLLNRFAYGPAPGDCERLSRMGLENWVEQQLKATPEPVARANAVSAELQARKLRRAVRSPNQVCEVLAEFWFNHFNVSLTDGDCQPYVGRYEAEAIYPNALGPFRKLLGATAHHPAMLYYLDNAYSTASKTGRPSEMVRDPLGYELKPQYRKDRSPMMVARDGLNENYARELLELHTLGVDGGYRQQDVRETARAFTGWSVQAPVVNGRANPAAGRFVFRPENHDWEPKNILFGTLSKKGEAEGEEILDRLATHNSTARFVAKKFAVRFLQDEPPPEVVDALARAFLSSQGDSRMLVRTLLMQPAFWQRQSIGAKVKSPFELIASSLRIAGSNNFDERLVVGHLTQMGQDLYSYRAPTGWPDRASYWVSPGNVLNRMAFALDMAEGRLGTVRLRPTLIAKEKGSKAAVRPEVLLQRLGEEILPGRNLESTQNLLMQAVLDPDYSQRVRLAKSSKGKLPKPVAGKAEVLQLTPQQKAKTVGLLLGCPEFQRR